MNEEGISLSLDQVESLILSLYQPNPPEIITKTQATLSRLQSSQHAWILARHLLGRSDEKVKFFGVLTIIIKLNTESAALSDEDATELLMSLVGWYIDALTQSTGPLVAKKLSSALAAFFHHFHRLWPRYLTHLAYCFATRQVIPPGTVPSSLDTPAILQQLDPAKLQGIIWIVTTIVEDSTKFDLNAANNIGLYEAILQHTLDSVSLISSGISRQDSLATQEDSIRCLQSWIWFSQKAATRDSQVIEALRPLISTVIEALAVPSLYDVSAELLTEILSNFPAILSQDHYGMLSGLFESEWCTQRFQNLLGGDFGFESSRFGQLLLAFGDARVQNLMQSDRGSDRDLLSKLCGLLAADGCIVIEDTIFVPALEFWSTFVETMTDDMYAGEGETHTWVETALPHILQAVSHAWQKITYPQQEDFSRWDSSDRVGFHDARKDVADFLQSTYTIVGLRLVYTFAELLLSALANSSWYHLEAAAFCLSSLADCVREAPDSDDALSSVFGSPLFSTLQASQADIPARVKQTCVSLIEHYCDYFERNVAQLPAAVGVLFAMVGDPSMATAASRSIHRLCSSCRHHLHPEISAFLKEYHALVSRRQLDCPSSEKILGAVSAVAQAIPDAGLRLSTCAEILDLIYRDVQCFKQLLVMPDQCELPCAARPQCLRDASDEFPALHVGLRVLRCLANMAKGLKSPSDVLIDVEGSDTRELGALPDLIVLQRKIISIIVEVQSTFSNCAEVTELICSILRSGFSETEPGPFVLAPNDVVQYLTKHSTDTPRIGVFVSTACSFASSLRSRQIQGKQEILAAVLLWVIGLSKQLSDPDSDPELSQNCIDFVTRIVSTSPGSLLELQPPDAAEFFLLFTLRVLDDKEPLPKAAAAEFWATFVNLNIDDSTRLALYQGAMDMLGPMLCQSLARNIGGNASRSELDKLSEPLKKLVNRYPKAKDWLHLGLTDPSFPSQKVSLDQKTFFIKKVISLRGSRATNQVVREFWLSSRGSNFAYAS
ncbi:armadillo-type protein [Stachybotrys elegans]|uniref:Armadillo-type protein n=1 Tax=Stachybotrys elegans TaxID=80388 RepID=A0A8K0WL66_9HYPO|nr:armadillo-type protein [Stachybotrys elegans]